MDLLQHLALGFETALTPLNLFYCFAGVLIGTLIGVLPGLGPAPTVAMLLPLSFGLPPVSGFIMLSGIFYGAQYGGSTTAILINTPGESSAVVTALEGYQMARQGRAGEALAMAAVGSFIAGTIATLIIALLAPPLAKAALLFGPAEYFSLMVLGLIAAIALASGSVLKAVAMAVVGLLLGLVGTDVTSGVQRYTFGVLDLFDGIAIVALAMGLFAVAEVLRNLDDSEEGHATVAQISGLAAGLKSLHRAMGSILRGTAIGSLLGILPGGGATLSSFASYAVEKRLSKEPSRFGSGVVEGLAGPESANNAGAQTSFIPMLTLGLPSNPVMALMIGALMIHGIQPGPNVITEQPALFWGLIASMWIGNVMLVVLNLPLVGLWVRLLTFPYHLLFPTIVVITCIGVFSFSNSMFDVWMLILISVVGYILIRLRCEPAPLLLGFILGPMMEEHLRRALLLSRGNPTVFVERPLSALMLLVAGVLIVAPALSVIRRRRDEIFVED
ncbi:tripartite tricarboxylate transporter permease [Pseudorhizobium endolithicum]|uniref:Tripartite tricarboxylate transporter permease n=1 Tax=Pseudorhizobium endolithicum TaxID=1191678 RepID=A0ABN7JML3_9HYPH|nr:tripartite tricarboxylate transporter permease [Pseudorhizobium endolithicum]CAD7037502.1 tripartite tricarboxylate transporter permease [Pseudorhizobium endolithicum]